MSVGAWRGDRRVRTQRERVRARWLAAYAPTRHLDAVLVISVLLLTVIGLLMIHSATAPRLELEGGSTTAYLVRQAVHAGVALAALAVVAAVDYRRVRAYALPAYIGAVALLGLVLSPLGTAGGGARRWLDIGPFQLQPSELAKVALVAMLAAVLHDRRRDVRPSGVVLVLAITAVPSVLVVLQPDLGTAAVFPVVAGVLLLIAGTRVRYLLGLAALAAVGVVAALEVGVLEPYQVARLTAFLDPGSAELARTSAYNTNQSMIAIGSGGLTGKGLLLGTQTNLSYVPENHTDFIFTVVGEEFGFVGAAVVLALFALIIWRGLRIAAIAKETFGTLLAVGAVAILAVQAVVNIGMTVGLAPVTGIPLPFVSYGGTSLIASYVLVGLLLNVHMRRF